MKNPFMKDVKKDDRLMIWIVFWVACSVIAMETASFQAVAFVTEYLLAMQVISVALMGIAIGGLLSFFCSKVSIEKTLTVSLTLFPLSILATYLFVIRLNDTPMLMMATMTLPYIFASLIISTVFNNMRPNLVYLFDLAGAGIGAVIVVLLIPLLREEGSLIFLSGMATIPIFLLWRRFGNEKKGIFVTAIVLLALNIGLLATHLTLDSFNMVHTARVDEEVYPRKIFRLMSDRYDLKYSKGSLIERIDIIKTKKGQKKKRINSVYNGRIVDTINSFKASLGRLDNRFPTRLKLGQNPDTLLVGPSGVGLCKPVQALGDGHIDAVEINGAIAGLMSGPLRKASGNAYDGMELTIGDVRTFMATTDRKYDFITLLNTHRIWSMGHTGAPEYCHTIEALHDYIDHLKPEGYVIFEERNINVQANLGTRKLIATAVQALKEKGVKEPEKHIGIWELWHKCKKRAWDSGKCRRRNLFTFIMVKATPITEEEYTHFQEWAKELGDRSKPDGYFRGIKWQYLPQESAKDSEWPEVVMASSQYDLNDINPEIHNMDIATDDRPYPFDIFKSRELQWSIFKNTTILALIMVLLPTLVTFFVRRDKGETNNSNRGRRLTNMVLVLFFAILGVGYLLIEIVLMQKFAVFLSSPIYAVVIVLGTMLIASGLGGYFSNGMARKRVLLSMAGILVLSAIAFATYSSIIDALMFLPFPLRILATIILIAPVSFFMGIPFPYAMSLAKEKLTARHAGLFFGINGALGAIATPLALITSIYYGFNFTILLGAAAYLVCLGLLVLVPKSADVKAPAASTS